jgi:hypothetical protein
MKMTGLFHLTLLPSTDAAKFERQITEVAFANVGVMQLTRTTSGFDHRLFKRNGELRQYVWQAEVTLMTDHPYDFAGNIPKVEDAVKGMAVVSGLDVFTFIGEKK